MTNYIVEINAKLLRTFEPLGATIASKRPPPIGLLATGNVCLV